MQEGGDMGGGREGTNEEGVCHNQRLGLIQFCGPEILRKTLDQIMFTCLEAVSMSEVRFIHR